MTTIQSVATGAIILFSAVVAGVGFGKMLQFNGTAGEQGAAPAQWPRDSRVKRNPAHPVLLVFAHPFCVCTKATIRELARVLESQRKPIPIDVQVLFFRPLESPEWERGELWNEAAALPGAVASWDSGGLEAKRFGARTSGFIAFYDASGAIRFQGGVTGSRGHVGDNYGAVRLARAVLNGPADAASHRVFGCALLGSNPSGFLDRAR